MPKKRSGRLDAIMYIETGTEFVLNKKTHQYQSRQGRKVAYAILRSCFFGVDKLPPIIVTDYDNAVAAIIELGKQNKKTQVIVDDGRQFIANSMLSKYVDGTVWKVVKNKIKYKLASDAAALPKESFAFYLSDSFFSVGVCHTETGNEIDILSMGNFGIGELEDFAEYTRNNSVIKFVENPKSYSLQDCLVNRLSLFISYHAAYIRLCKDAGNLTPQRSLSQTGDVIYRIHRPKFAGEPHNDEFVSVSERQACAGPMIRLLQSGRYEDWCYVLDVSSLYPFIGLHNQFPCTLLKHIYDPDEKEIEKAMKYGWILAKCNVTCNNQSLPKITDGHCSWPIGTYNTWLPDPEFRKAWYDRAVNRIMEVVIYGKTFLLKDYCEFMLEMRKKYKESGQLLNEMLIKAITNTVFGNFAARTSVWVPYETADKSKKWHTWHAASMVGVESQQYRTICGEAEKFYGRVEKDGTMPAVFAAITSHARLTMNQYIDIAGKENVFAVNTDAIICNHEAMKRLESNIAFLTSEVGKLRIAERGKYCVCYSSRQRKLAPPGDEASNVASVSMRTETIYDALQLAAIGESAEKIDAIVAAGMLVSYQKTVSMIEEVNKEMSPIQPEVLAEPPYHDGLFFTQ